MTAFCGYHHRSCVPMLWLFFFFSAWWWSFVFSWITDGGGGCRHNVANAFLLLPGRCSNAAIVANGCMKTKTVSYSKTSFLASSSSQSGDMDIDIDNNSRSSSSSSSSNDEQQLLVLQHDNDLNPKNALPPEQVQRYYHTFQWKYHLKSPSPSTTTPTTSTTTATEYRTYNINYRREGNCNDPPILLIHGFGANVNHYRYNIPLLVQEGYQVFAIDLLGFGASDKPKDEDYSISLWVDLLCDFIQEMTESMVVVDDDNGGGGDNIETNIPKHPWVVCGNSIGGLCSLGVTAKMKHLVHACVLFNCAQGMSGFRYEEAPFWVRPIMYFIQKVVLAPDGYGGKFFENFKTRDNVKSILLQQGVYGDRTNVNEELLEILLGPSEDEGAKEVFLKVFGGPAGPTPEEFLREIECPILAIWGDSDPWVPVDRGTHQGLNFGEYTRGEYTLEILKGVGHCPHDEVPVQVHEKMMPWLESIGLPSKKQLTK